MEKYGYVKSRCVWFYNGNDMFRDYINSLKLTVTEEMYKRHDREYAGSKKTYSSRANMDSEYLEDNIIENLDEAVRFTGPHKFLADVSYRNMKIDFKEIATQWYHVKHPTSRYLNAFQKQKLTHFLFFRSNRPRNNQMEYKKTGDYYAVIPVGFELQFEYLGCYDVMQVLNHYNPEWNNVRIQTLQEKYGTI